MQTTYTFNATFTYPDEPNPIDAPTSNQVKENELLALIRAAIAEKDYTSIIIKIDRII